MVRCRQEREIFGKTSSKFIIFVRPIVFIPIKQSIMLYRQLAIVCFFCLTMTYCMAQSSAYEQAIIQGENAANNRQYAQAVQYYAQAIKIKPSNPEPYLKQMECAIQKRDLTIFKRSIQQLEGLEYPLILDVYLTYAQLAKKQRLYNDGLAMLDKAELKHKKTKSILLHRAELYQKLNKSTEVIKTLNETLDLYPNSLDVWHQLATLYMQVNKKKSIDCFKKLLVEESYKDIALSSLGLLYTQMYEEDKDKKRSNLVQALSYYNQYYKRHPKDQETRNLIENIRILLEA